MLKFMNAVFAALVLGYTGLVVAQAPDEYGRCAACHLPDGAGVPGVFPPLKERLGAIAGLPEAREYLVLVVDRGLAGPITAAGVPYAGMMPGQGGALDHEATARVLNFVATGLNKAPSDWQPFTAEEVKSVLARFADADVNQVLVMRQALFSQHPELQ